MPDFNELRNDFKMFKNNPELVYFDSAATSFKPNCVIEAIGEYYEKCTTNIHRGEYKLSYEISKLYDSTRELVASFINAQTPEIIFTSGTTYGLNQVAFGYGLANLQEGDIILTTYAEHASSILPWFNVAKEKKAVIKYIPLDENGLINEENFKKVLNNKVKFVVIGYISNVLGKIQNIGLITKMAHKQGALVVVDAAQAAPHIAIDVKRDDIDFLAFSGHKMLAPTGSGVLYGKSDLLKQMRPLVYGGDANARFDADTNIILKDIPIRFEAGTQNIEAVLGLRAAINYLNKIGMDNIEKYEHELIAYLNEKAKRLDNIDIINPNADIAIFSFNCKNIFAQDVATYLASQNIAVRSGNHCAKILHNLIGTDSSIRASLYFYNNKEEIDYFINILKDITLEKCIGAVL